MCRDFPRPAVTPFFFALRRAIRASTSIARDYSWNRSSPERSLRFHLEPRVRAGGVSPLSLYAFDCVNPDDRPHAACRLPTANGGTARLPAAGGERVFPGPALGPTPATRNRAEGLI